MLRNATCHSLTSVYFAPLSHTKSPIPCFGMRRARASHQNIFCAPTAYKVSSTSMLRNVTSHSLKSVYLAPRNPFKYSYIRKCFGMRFATASHTVSIFCAPNRKKSPTRYFFGMRQATFILFGWQRWKKCVTWLYFFMNKTHMLAAQNGLIFFLRMEVANLVTRSLETNWVGTIDIFGRVYVLYKYCMAIQYCTKYL